MAKTKVIGIRLTGEEIKTLTIRAMKRDMPLAAYMKWVLLRKHGGREGLEGEHYAKRF